MKKINSPTIRYLGNKRRLLPIIDELMHSNHKPGSTVIDIFAGSSSVGYHLLNDYRIVTNDIEGYSYFIGKALIESSGKMIEIDRILETLLPDFLSNRSLLSSALSDFIDKENQILSEIPNFQEYSDFCSSTPYIARVSVNGMGPKVNSIFSHALSKPSTPPYCLFTTYFMNSYFGVEQCIDIDSLRYAIDLHYGPVSGPKNDIVFSKLMCAFFYTLSNCVASPGHFAQSSHPNNEQIYRRILKERQKDVWVSFRKYFIDLFREPKSNSFQNLAYQLDALELLRQLTPELDRQNDVLVYIDPPYTADHYSRYYHILNTLLLYDYPECEHKGRYRSDRFTSTYSIKSKAMLEITELLLEANTRRFKVMMSYRSGGLVPLTDLYQLCFDIFQDVSWVMVPFMHSSQGRSLKENNNLRYSESLFVCSPSN